MVASNWWDKIDLEDFALFSNRSRMKNLCVYFVTLNKRHTVGAFIKIGVGKRET